MSECEGHAHVCNSIFKGGYKKDDIYIGLQSAFVNQRFYLNLFNEKIMIL